MTELCLNYHDSRQCRACKDALSHRKKACYTRAPGLIVITPDGAVCQHSELEDRLWTERNTYLGALKEIRQCLDLDRPRTEMDAILKELKI